MERLNRITEKIIGCAIQVHKNLGPGLLESIYEKKLNHKDHKGTNYTKDSKI